MKTLLFFESFTEHILIQHLNTNKLGKLEHELLGFIISFIAKKDITSKALSTLRGTKIVFS